MPPSYQPFSIQHLLLNGFVIDRGQLTPARRAELNAQTKAGELLKDAWLCNAGAVTVWRLPTMPDHQVQAVLARTFDR